MTNLITTEEKQDPDGSLPMDEFNTSLLRRLVNLPNAQVVWSPDGESIRYVDSVPLQELDPDNTGVKCHIATLRGGGHVDLLDVDFTTFKLTQEIFEKGTK